MLAPIPGGHLRKDAALRWNSQALYCRRHGLPVPMPNGPFSSYRNFSGQVLMRRQWCARGQCQNAAIPGTSNHGLGIAVDNNQGWVCDKLDHLFGWGRSHSDAPWESWHRKWGGFGRILRPKPDEVILTHGMRHSAVRTLQLLLRRAGYIPRRRKLGSKYGNRTLKAVKRFQRAHHLHADGVVGPATWKALRRASKKK